MKNKCNNYINTYIIFIASGHFQYTLLLLHFGVRKCILEDQIYLTKQLSQERYSSFAGKPGITLLKNTETSIPSTGITLEWTAAEENGGEILTYIVWKREVLSNGAVGRWFTQNTTSNAVTFRVTGLEFGKTYQFGVTAWNKYGQSALDTKNGLITIKIIGMYFVYFIFI